MMKKILPLIATLLLVTPAFATTIVVHTNVQKYISVTFNYNSVDFGTLTAGTNDNPPTPSYTTGVYNVTIDTNYDYNVSASGSNFADVTETYFFSISNLEFQVDTDTSFDGTWYALSTSPQVVYQGDSSDTINYHAYRLDIPSGQYATSYDAIVTITYVNQ